MSTTENNKAEVISFRVSSRVLTRARRTADKKGYKVGELARLGLLRMVEMIEKESRNGQ
jgi:hypothetical protein